MSVPHPVAPERIADGAVAQDLLERYLQRLGLDTPVAEARRRLDSGGSSALTLLDELLATHAGTICFENLDVLAHHRVSIEAGSVTAKLLDDGRGGYCHEHACLVREVLTALEVPCRPVLARVLLRPGDELGPLTHQATLAEVDGRPVLVDPGFGAGTPTVALPLDDPSPRGTVHGQFRLVTAAMLPEADRLADIAHVLQTREGQDGDWRSVYGLVEHDWQASDLAMSNWYSATEPGTLFVNHLVAVRTLPDGRRATLKDRQLRQVDHRTGRREEHHLDGKEELASILGEVFGLQVDESLVAAAWQVASRA